MSAIVRVRSLLPRLLAVALTATLGLTATAAALSAAMARVAPDQATVLYPGNASALNRRAALRVAMASSGTGSTATTKISAEDRTAVRELAYRSLTSTLLNPVALRLMGLAVSPTLEGSRARPWMEAASSISRRDSASHMWLALDMARRGDAIQTINHVDYAMRSSFSTAETLTPVLVTGLDDPTMRRRIPELVRAKVFWTGRFLEDATYKSKRPDIVADIVVASGGFPDKAAENERVLLGRLIAEGYYDEALSFGRFMNKEALRIARGVDIADAAIEKPVGQIGWQINPSVTSMMLADDRQPAFLVQIDRDRTSVVASKLLYSPRSSMRLTGSAQFAERAPSDAFRVEVGCPTANGTPFRAVGQPIRAVTADPQKWAVDFSTDCDPVAIRFVATSDLGGAGNELVLTKLALGR